MARRETAGVRWYSRGTAQAESYFPEGDVCCRHCRFCVRDPFAPSLRHVCALEQRIIYAPDFQADFCPLTIIDEKEREE